MDKRLELHSILCDVLGSDYVYFQAPDNLQMKYPCIRYSVKGIDDKFADDTKYLTKKRYEVMIIDSNPDSNIPDKVSTLPFSKFVDRYTKDNLNHSIYNLYF